MAYTQLSVEQEGRVRVLYLDRPGKKNALSEQLAAELVAALKEADADREVGAVVLTGRGEAFCAGGDLADFAAMATRTAPELHREGAASSELFQMGLHISKPLIAAVNGPALGGGCGLVAMCHLAVASETALLGTPEIKVGMFPFVIFPLLMRAVGPRRALALALTGRLLSAREACEMGLVHEVLPPERFTEGYRELAARVAGFSPLVLRLGLNAYRTALDMEIHQAMDYLNTLRVIDFLSEDLREGAMAFLQKRPPEWKGR